MAHSAFTQHGKSIFQNQDIALPKRIQFFQSLVLSKMVYGCESWILNDARSKEYLHAAVMKLYRRILRIAPDAPQRDLDVLMTLGLPTPTERLRQARLRYLGTLHACSSVVPWGLLNQDQAWCALLQDDLQWMWQQLHHSSSLPDPQQSLPSWRYLWQYHRSYWKGLIKRASKHAI